jgi:Fur family peroxide stress response transcriptional regulator
MTPQRLEVIRILATSDGHPSALQIYEDIKNKFPTMSQATVYNTIALLKEMHQILEIDLHGDSHYDGNRPEEHAHLICIGCNKILDADFEFDDEEIKGVETSSGYQVVRSQVTFYGYCPDCKSVH